MTALLLSLLLDRAAGSSVCATEATASTAASPHIRPFLLVESTIVVIQMQDSFRIATIDICG